MNKILLTTALSIFLKQTTVLAQGMNNGLGLYSTAGATSTTYGISTANAHGALWITSGTMIAIAEICKYESNNIQQFSECLVYESFELATLTISHSKQLLENISGWTSEGAHGTTNASGKITDRLFNKSDAEKAAIETNSKDLLNVAAGYLPENESTEVMVNAIIESSKSFQSSEISRQVAAMIAYNFMQKLLE